MKRYKFRDRRGFTLVELMIVMFILIILIGITVASMTGAQKRARLTDVRTALGSYEDSFIYATSEHATFFSDRCDAWGTDGTGYSDKVGLASLVRYMNESLDEPFQFSYNDATKRYESLKEDPWGGRYILTGYPVSDSDPTHNYNDSSPGKPGYETVGVSIWCTGNSDVINTSIYANATAAESAPPIDKECYGIGLLWSHGLTEVAYHGFEDEIPFAGYYLIYQ